MDPLDPLGPTDAPGSGQHLADVPEHLPQEVLRVLPQAAPQAAQAADGGEAQQRRVQEEREEAAALRLIWTGTRTTGRTVNTEPAEPGSIPKQKLTLDALWVNGRGQQTHQRLAEQVGEVLIGSNTGGLKRAQKEPEPGQNRQVHPPYRRCCLRNPR